MKITLNMKTIPHTCLNPLLFCMGVVCSLFLPEQSYSQQQATLKHYYPYSAGPVSKKTPCIGLRKVQGMSVDFYVIPFGKKLWNGTDSVDIAYDVFEKARKVWNDENFGVTINNAGFAQANDNINKTTNKNLFGIGNEITSSNDNEYGAAQPYNTVYATRGRYEYNILVNMHIELNGAYFDSTQKKLILDTPTQDSVQNVYSVAVHELGHALGLGDNIADATSIMSYSWNTKQPFSPVLSITDRKLIRALYPRIPSGHENDICLPR